MSVSVSDDEDLDNLSGAELGAALMRQQTKRRKRKEQILEDQVRELRYLRLRQSQDNGAESEPSPQDTSVRIKHLLLLDECNSMWDILPISKAINYLQDHPAPHGTDAIPFEIGSDEWCFVILLLHQEFECMYDYNDDLEQHPLLLMDQAPKDACIENGLVCGQCLKISPPRRCTRCKMLRYCNSDCQSTHWKGEHKKQCRPERLKPSDDYSRSTRKRYCEENGSAITFIREHDYPATVDDVRSFIGPTPSYYTESIHGEFEKVYNMIGKNTFKVYGREFGMLLYEYGQTHHEGRGMDVLHSAERVLLKVISNYPLLSDDREREEGHMMIAEVLARRLLSSSWDGIGDWIS